MVIFLDLINIRKGGAVQVALSVIYEFSKRKDIIIHCVINDSIFHQIDKSIYHDRVFFHKYILTRNFVFRRRVVNKDMIKMEAEVDPTVVFTLFGPSYWQPTRVHVTGFADGWCYNPGSIAWDKLSLKDRVKFSIITKLKVNKILKSTVLIVETDIAKHAIVNLYDFPEERIFTVGNTYSHFFNDSSPRISKDVQSPYKLLVLSAYYPHKNLEIIKDVAKVLSLDADVEVEFIMTLPEDTFSNVFSESENVNNVGPVAVENCRKLYEECDALFLPTLLETFSANYPEAMKMGLPILTSNLDFARYVCAEAALFFDPLSAADIATKIKQLVLDSFLREELVKRGQERLRALETPESRAIKYFRILEKSSL